MNIDIIGMPLFYGCDKPGVEKGPEELRKSNLVDILTKNHIVRDLGDILVEKIDSKDKFASHPNLKYLDEIVASNTRLAEKVLASLENNAFPFIIGGDHSLALGSLAGVSKYFGNDIAVIWIDAHGDINTEETSPSGNIHGMPLASSMGVGPKKLTSLMFDEIKIKPENVFILGCRDLDIGELKLIDDLKLNVWNYDEIRDKGLDTVISELLTLLKEKDIKDIHLSYDIDCLDPEYVPGTGTPVEDGMNFEQSRILLKSILSTSLVKSMDLVEYNPDLDIDGRTNETCVELLKFLSEAF